MACMFLVDTSFLSGPGRTNTVGPADGREEGASEGPAEGSRDGEMLGMPEGTLEGVEEGDDDSTSDGLELGFWLTVGSSDAVNDGSPLGPVEGDDVVGATCIKEEERRVERGQFEMFYFTHNKTNIPLFFQKKGNDNGKDLMVKVNLPADGLILGTRLGESDSVAVGFGVDGPVLGADDGDRLIDGESLGSNA